MTRDQSIKTRIILCPTLRRAYYEWHKLATTYPDMWIKCCRNPMSLTSVTGIKYMFYLENEIDKLRGRRADFISVDDIRENDKKL